ncbi:MAG TPA: hypothetical protein VGK89_10870 [Candidatus Eisenbacteria bacterium]|jgi:hypothetical protein
MEIDSVRQFFVDPAVIASVRFLIVLFGSVAMYVFQLNRGFEGALGFLRRILPGRSDAFYSRVDFIVVSLAGSAIGQIIFEPRTPFQALAAGVGWVGAMNSLLAGSLRGFRSPGGGQP